MYKILNTEYHFHCIISCSHYLLPNDNKWLIKCGLSRSTATSTNSVKNTLVNAPIQLYLSKSEKVHALKYIRRKKVARLYCLQGFYVLFSPLFMFKAL